MNTITLGINLYKIFISPIIHRLGIGQFACRYSPTCSEYAESVIKKHGLIKGGRLAIVRFISCR